MNKHEIHDTPTTSATNAEGKKSRYVPINGQKVHLTPEEQRAYDQMINHERYRARKNKSCSQPDYHKCRGDCAVCPYHVYGTTVSVDDETYDDGNARRNKTPLLTSPAPDESISAKDSCRRIYRKADELYKNGARILYMKTVEGRSTYEISEELGMPQTTVNKYVNRLLAYLREHREDFI